MESESGIGTGAPIAVPGHRAEAREDETRFRMSPRRSLTPDIRHPTSATIVAISTPPGKGGIGVVRLSGPDSRSIAERILRFPHPPEWRTWGSTLAELPETDQVVVSFFEGPRSYTAEDVVEISCHGAPVVLRHCVQRAVEAGARLAAPGEFTFRAFLNGRI